MLQRPTLLPPTPMAAAAQAARQRRLRTLAAAGAAGITILLLLAVENWQHSKDLDSVTGASSSRHALGMPADTLLLGDPGGSGGAMKGGAAGGSGGSWWQLWQGRIADQEARVNKWRERQRALVYEETVVDEVAHASSSDSKLQLSHTVTAEAAAAAVADPLLEQDTAQRLQLGLAGGVQKHVNAEGAEEFEQEAAAAARAAAAAGGQGSVR